MPICKSPVYLIEFSCVNTGKRVASSKKRIVWKFGFTNQEALAQNKTGQDCRGEEHEVVLIWSVASGKRVVLFNNQEVHYSNNRHAEFHCSWAIRPHNRNGGANGASYNIQIVALLHPSHISHKQYNLLINNQSVFDLPKISELGRPMQASNSRLDGRRRSSFNNLNDDSLKYEIPRSHNEEQAFLAEAIRNSLVDDYNPQYRSSDTVKSAPSSRRSGGDYTYDTPKPQDDLLLDLLSDPNPPPTVAPSAPMSPTSPTTANMVVDDPFAPKPTNVVNGILATYDIPPPGQPQYNNYSVPLGSPGVQAAAVPVASPPYSTANPGERLTSAYSNSTVTTPNSVAPVVPAPQPAVVSPTLQPTQPTQVQPPVPNTTSAPTSSPVPTQQPTSVPPVPPNLALVATGDADEYANPFIIADTTNNPPTTSAPTSPAATTGANTAPNVVPPLAGATYYPQPAVTTPTATASSANSYPSYASPTQAAAPPPVAPHALPPPPVYGNGMYSAGTMGMNPTSPTGVATDMNAMGSMGPMGGMSPMGMGGMAPNEYNKVGMVNPAAPMTSTHYYMGGVGGAQ